VSCKLPYFGDL